MILKVNLPKGNNYNIIYHWRFIVLKYVSVFVYINLFLLGLANFGVYDMLIYFTTIVSFHHIVYI